MHSMDLLTILTMVEQTINIMVREGFNQQLSVLTQSGKSVGEVYSEGEDTAIISSGQCNVFSPAKRNSFSLVIGHRSSAVNVFWSVL